MASAVRLRIVPLVEVVEDDEHGAEVGAVGAEHERLARDDQSVLDAGRVQDDLLGLVHHLLRCAPPRRRSGNWALMSR